MAIKTKKSETNYIGSIGTYFHLAGVLANIFFLCNEGRKINAVIYVRKSPYGFKVSEDTYVGTNYSIKVVHLDRANAKRLRKYFFFLNEILSKIIEPRCFFAYPKRQKLNPACTEQFGFLSPVQCMEIDEGITSYASKRSTVKLKKYRSQGQYKQPSKQKLKSLLYPIFSLLRGKGCRNSWQILKNGDKNNPLRINSETSQYYHMAFRVLGQRKVKDLSSLPPNKGCFLYIAQPAGEKLPFSVHEQIEIVKWLSFNIEKSGRKLLVKPYFKDVTNWEGLEVSTIGEGLCSEDLFTVWKPDAVIGFPSTSLITASAIFDIPCYDLTESNVCPERYKKYLKLHDGCGKVSASILRDVSELSFDP